MSGGEGIQGAFRLLFEAEEDGARFFQVAVVVASGEWAAQAQLEEHLAREGVQLICVDPEETRALALPSLPRAHFVDGEHGVVELSGRMRVVTPVAVRPAAAAALH